MVYKTHQKFAISWAFLGTMLLYANNLMQINYYIALILMIPYVKVGAAFPDLDHSWENVKNKNLATFIVNRLIHLTGGQHRSWQTHSLDLAVWFTILSYFGPTLLYKQGILKIDLVSLTIINIILVGFSIGWLSHIFADMLTSGKIRLISFLDFEVGFVPRKFLWINFNTGGGWEEFVGDSVGFLNTFIMLIAIAYGMYIN